MPTFGDSRLPERFWVKCAPSDDGCWRWHGSRMRNGYGQIRMGRRIESAHRVAFQALVGPIPDGYDADHLCRNRECVNPAHIQPVTRSENVRRGDAPKLLRAYNLGKTHCPSGHAYSAANTVIYSGKRVCRQCRAARNVARRKSGAVLSGVSFDNGGTSLTVRRK